MTETGGPNEKDPHIVTQEVDHPRLGTRSMYHTQSTGELPNDKHSEHLKNAFSLHFLKIYFQDLQLFFFSLLNL